MERLKKFPTALLTEKALTLFHAEPEQQKNNIKRFADIFFNNTLLSSLTDIPITNNPNLLSGTPSWQQKLMDCLASIDGAAETGSLKCLIITDTKSTERFNNEKTAFSFFIKALVASQKLIFTCCNRDVVTGDNDWKTLLSQADRILYISTRNDEDSLEETQASLPFITAIRQRYQTSKKPGSGKIPMSEVIWIRLLEGLGEVYVSGTYQIFVPPVTPTQPKIGSNTVYVEIPDKTITALTHKEVLSFTKAIVNTAAALLRKPSIVTNFLKMRLLDEKSAANTKSSNWYKTPVLR